MSLLMHVPLYCIFKPNIAPPFDEKVKKFVVELEKYFSIVFIGQGINDSVKKYLMGHQKADF